MFRFFRSVEEIFCRLDWVVQVRCDDRFGLQVSGCLREFWDVLLLYVVSNRLMLFCVVVFGSVELVMQSFKIFMLFDLFRFKLSGLFCLSSCFKLL